MRLAGLGVLVQAGGSQGGWRCHFFITCLTPAHPMLPSSLSRSSFRSPLHFAPTQAGARRDQLLAGIWAQSSPLYCSPSRKPPAMCRGRAGLSPHHGATGWVWCQAKAGLCSPRQGCPAASWAAASPPLPWPWDDGCCTDPLSRDQRPGPSPPSGAQGCSSCGQSVKPPGQGRLPGEYELHSPPHPSPAP